MRDYLAEGFYIICAVGCFAILFAAPACKTAPEVSEPIYVTPEGLYRNFRDTPQAAAHAWKDRQIKVRIQAKHYRVSGQTVQWLDSYPAKVPGIVFDTNLILPDASKAIDIVGTCRGRSNEVDPWHVYCEACRVTVLE